MESEAFMKSNTDAVVILVAAFLVLFSTMWDLLVSAAVCVTVLIAFAVYELARRNG